MNALLSSPILSWLLSYLFNAVWQVPLIFAAAWIAARMLRGAHPGIGHRVWVGALLLEAVLPACSLRVADLWHALLSLFPITNAADAGEIRVIFGSATATGGTLRLPLVFEAGIVLVWICCLLYFAVRLVWGLRQTRILARSASRITLTGDAALRWVQHCQRLGITTPLPEIAASPQGIGPVTVGLRRGLVLLPSAFLESIPAADLDAVLAHELAHIHRHDFAKNLLYGLVSLPIAWYPVGWWTRSRIAESRELICDAIAGDAIDGPRKYAQSLLRLAAMLSGQPPIATFQAIGILSFNTDSRTFERRVMNLTRARIPLSTSRRILLSVACSILALATCTSALALHRDFSAPAAAHENKAPTKVAVRADIMAKERISGDNPTYPPEARKKKTQGTVVLDTTISKEGAIEDLDLVKTPDPSLAESAMKAVRTWRYRPYLLNGEPVAVKTTVNVTFCLEPCTLSGWWNHPGSTP